MDLLRVVRRPEPQYSADSFREAKCTRLGYATRLSRLHTLDPPLALGFSRGSHSATQVPQAGLSAKRLHNSNKKQDREKATDHMRIKIYKKHT
jgi:hypothetical protein